MIDLHSHIIWDIDDGSKSKEMTLKMLKEAEINDTKKIVATPHYVKGEYECTYEEVKEKLKEVKKIAKENNLNIEIYPGQEVHYKEHIIELYLNKEIGTINDTKYMLIELPILGFSVSEVIDSIYELAVRGIVPVLAHPERYRDFIKEPFLINEFIKEGWLFQLNAGSIAGIFGKEVKKTAEIYIKNNIYNFIGSDAHRDKGRSTNMTEGINAMEALNKGYASLIKESSEKLLNNEEVIFIGKTIDKKKKLFSFLRQ